MASSGKAEFVAMECDVEGEEEDVIGRSEADLQFDATIGHIEDVLISDDFQALQDKFLESHYKYFEEGDENKLEYTKIHQQYIDSVESHLEKMLKKRVPGFNMERFAEQLVSREREELEGEVFDVLLTFSDFVAFREMMIDYRGSKEGNQIDLCVTGRNAVSLGLVGTSLLSAAGGSKSATLQTLKAKHAAASGNAATRSPTAQHSSSATPTRPSNAAKPASAGLEGRLQKIDLSVNTSPAKARAGATSSAKPSSNAKPASTPLTKGSAAKPTTKPK